MHFGIVYIKLTRNTWCWYADLLKLPLLLHQSFLPRVGIRFVDVFAREACHIGKFDEIKNRITRVSLIRETISVQNCDHPFSFMAFTLNEHLLFVTITRTLHH